MVHHCRRQSEARIVQYNQAQLHGLPEHLADQPYAKQSERLQPGYLLLYAKKEQQDALAQHELLTDQPASRDLDWQPIDWRAIDAGSHRETARAQMLESARALVVLLSPSLLAELERSQTPFAPRRPIIPLALKPVAPEQLQGTAFSGLEIFRDQGQEAWTATSGHKREQWVSEAAVHLVHRLDGPEQPRQRLDLLAQRARLEACDPDHYIEQRFDDRAPGRGRADDQQPTDGKTAPPSCSTGWPTPRPTSSAPSSASSAWARPPCASA